MAALIYIKAPLAAPEEALLAALIYIAKDSVGSSRTGSVGSSKRGSVGGFRRGSVGGSNINS